MLGEIKPDLAIIDWDLAILSGEEFIRLTRTPKTSPAPTVPIILMLSKPQRYAVDRAVALGVNEVIAKPFSPKVLWSRLDEVLNRPRGFVEANGLLRPAPRAGAAAEKARGLTRKPLPYGLGSGAEPLHYFVPTRATGLLPRWRLGRVDRVGQGRSGRPAEFADGHVAADEPAATIDPRRSRTGSDGRPPWPHAHHRRAAASGTGHSYAALDLGTNNCRLLVAEPAPFGFRVIDAFSRIVRLGEGLGIGNRLSEAAIERTIEALRVCRDKMQHRNVGPRAPHRHRGVPARRQRRRVHRPRPVTSSASSSRSSTGAPRPIWRSPAARRSPIRDAESVVVFDIGGGSTEIAWLDGPAPQARSPTRCKRIRAWDSLPVGVVTLAERHGGVDVTPETFEAMVEEVTRCCSISRSIAAGRRRARAQFHLLGTSGTVTTVGGMHLGLPRYDRRRVDGLWMRDGDVTAVLDGLLDTQLRRSGPPIPASAATAPTSCSPAAPSSRRSGGRSRPTACASPIAACARAS